MVSHLLKVGSDDYTSNITIQEENNECVIILDDNHLNTQSEAYLTLEQLHSFIGTLLHVQQKLKNR
jgi:hypothetical protein